MVIKKKTVKKENKVSVKIKKIGFAKLTKAERSIIARKGGYARHGLRQTPTGRIKKI